MQVNRWCCFKNRPPQSDINSCLRNSSLDVSFMNETLQPGHIHSVIVCEEESKNQRDENFVGLMATHMDILILMDILIHMVIVMEVQLTYYPI